MRQGSLNVATWLIVNGRLGSGRLARVDLCARRGRHQSQEQRRIQKRLHVCISSTHERSRPTKNMPSRVLHQIAATRLYNLRRGGTMNDAPQSSRRQLLRMTAMLGGGVLAQRQRLLAWETPGTLGAPLGPYGERSPFETAVRWHRESKTPETGSCFTPLHASVGTLTPSSLHYERHHSGIPTIDPSRHRLVIHGMVDRPLR